MALKVRNESGRSRKLSATGYMEWVLGDLRSKSVMHVITEIDATSGRGLRAEPYNTEFTGRIAFFDVDETTRPSPATGLSLLGATARFEVRLRCSVAAFREGGGWLALRRHPGSIRPGRRAGTRDHLQARRRARHQRGQTTCGSFPRICSARMRAGSGVAVLEAHSRRCPCGNARPVPQRADQRLALVPNSRVPPLGAERILSIGGASVSAISCRT